MCFKRVKQIPSVEYEFRPEWRTNRVGNRFKCLECGKSYTASQIIKFSLEYVAKYKSLQELDEGEQMKAFSPCNCPDSYEKFQNGKPTAYHIGAVLKHISKIVTQNTDGSKIPPYLWVPNENPHQFIGEYEIWRISERLYVKATKSFAVFHKEHGKKAISAGTYQIYGVRGLEGRRGGRGD